MNYREIKIAAIGLLILVYGYGQSAQAQTCAPAPVGLVSWYAGDGNAIDSRSGINGTLQNGATFAGGQVGQAFGFDGIDDRVDIPRNASVFALTRGTVEMWVKVPNLDDNVVRLFSIADAGIAFPQSDQWTIDYRGSNHSIQVLQVGGGTIFMNPLTPTNSINDNNFHHIAVVADGVGDIQIYIDGALQTLSSGAGERFFGNAANADNMKIGAIERDNVSAEGLKTIDEVSIYDRALSAGEIQVIFNAGTGGKCKPTATVAPSGQVGWWSGDGNANDIAGPNNGTLVGGAGFSSGKVGQSFVLGGGYVEVIDSPTLEVTTQLTIESWIKPSDTGQFREIVSKFGVAGNYAYQIGLAPNGALRTDLSQTGGPAYEQLTSPDNVITANAWNHVAVTFNTGVTTLYVNGSSVISATLPINSIFGSGNTNVNIGRDPVGLQYFIGIIDEASIYNRALSAIEIQAIFNAGQAGKLKTATTPLGFSTADFGMRNADLKSDVAEFSPQVVNTIVGDAIITFPTVSTAGITQQIPLDLSTLPSLPTGIISTGLTYDIATTATFTGSPTVCFNLPAFTPAQFVGTGVLHLEAGVWVNRTAASSFPSLCTTGLTSFSPFAIVRLSPTAASVPVSGRVTTAQGKGIRSVRVSLTDQSGNVRTALTSSFGYYRFDDVEAGQTYVIGVSSKRFVFADPTRIVSVQDELAGIDFTAEPF